MYLEPSPEEDDPGARAPEGLVHGGRDHVTVGEGGGNQASRHQTTATTYRCRTKFKALLVTFIPLRNS
jgi:hypothetical protein